MYLYVSFNLREGQKQELQKYINERKTSRIIRKFIKEEYVLPDKNRLIQACDTNFDNEVWPFLLDNESLGKMDKLVIEVESILITKFAKIGRYGGRSLLMRDIIDQLITRYKENPVPDSEFKRTTFRVAKGTREKLDNYIPQKHKNDVVIDFILDDYIPSSDDPTYFRNQLINGSELFYLTAPLEVYNRLEELVKKNGTNKINASNLFRDALEQLILDLTANNQPIR